MKKVLYTAALAVLTLTVGCTKEKEDTNNNNNSDLTTDIVGVYNGTNAGGAPIRITVTKVNDKMVSVVPSVESGGIWYQGLVHDSTTMNSKTSFTLNNEYTDLGLFVEVEKGEGTLSGNTLTINTHTDRYENGVLTSSYEGSISGTK